MPKKFQWYGIASSQGINVSAPRKRQRKKTAIKTTYSKGNQNIPPSTTLDGLPPCGGKSGTAGLGDPIVACRALTFKFPPSLELFLSLRDPFDFDSPSSAENVLMSSIDCVAARRLWNSSFSDFLPIRAPKTARGWRRFGFTGGIGGA